MAVSLPPLEHGRAEHAASPRAPDDGATERPTLLMLDDDSEICELVCEFAADLGYTCNATTDPERFVHIAREAQPTVLVLDLQMPQLDGAQVMQRLALERCISHILLASGVDEVVLDRAVRLGAAQGLRMLGWVRKPLLLDGLGAMLASISKDSERNGA